MSKKEEGSTAHKQVKDDVTPGAAPSDTETMPMGMTGQTPEHGDPDQKSTHVPPKTVEGVSADGSPKYMDPPKGQKTTKAKGGKFEVVSRVKTSGKTYEPGDIVELEAAEAESLGDNIKPA